MILEELVAQAHERLAAYEQQAVQQPGSSDADMLLLFRLVTVLGDAVLELQGDDK